eukprot:295530-Rhodomonas_salina.2
MQLVADLGRQLRHRWFHSQKLVQVQDTQCAGENKAGRNERSITHPRCLRGGYGHHESMIPRTPGGPARMGSRLRGRIFMMLWLVGASPVRRTLGAWPPARLSGHARLGCCVGFDSSLHFGQDGVLVVRVHQPRRRGRTGPVL